MLELKQNAQHLNNVIVIIRVIGIWCYKTNHLYPEQQKYISIYCFDLETLIYIEAVIQQLLIALRFSKS
jgi:hypothetical protein